MNDAITALRALRNSMRPIAPLTDEQAAAIAMADEVLAATEPKPAAPAVKWTRAKLEGWNEVEYRDSNGKFAIRSRMMAASRNGCWKKEWCVYDLSKTTTEGKPTYTDIETLRDAKAYCYEEE